MRITDRLRGSSIKFTNGGRKGCAPGQPSEVDGGLRAILFTKTSQKRGQNLPPRDPMRLVRARRRRPVAIALLYRAYIAVCITGLAAQISGPALAQAEADVLDLEWRAPNACPSERAADDQIRALIRHDRGAGERAMARARVLIEGSEQAGYSAAIEVERGTSSGERTLRGARCGEVADAAILIVAMAIDPEGASARAAQRATSTSAGTNTGANTTDATARAAAAEPTTTTSDPAATQPEKTDEQAPAPKEEAKEPDEQEEEEEEQEPEPPSNPRDAGRFSLGLYGVGDAGSLPHATLGAGLIAGLHWPRLRLQLQAGAYLPQVEHSGPTQSSSVKVGLYNATVTGCFDLLGTRDDARALGLCAAIEAGLSQGQPRQISDGRSSAGLWLAGFVGIDVRQRVLGPLQLGLFAQAGLPVLRPAYEIEPFGRVFRASPVLGRLGISAFVLFP